MLTLVILLVFSSKLVSSVIQTVTFDVQVIDTVTSCSSQQVDLMEGDDVYIETKVPSQVIYMWCQDQLGHKPIDRGSYDLNNHQFYTNATNLNITSLYGPWTCEYLMKQDPSIHTAVDRQGSTYSYAQCILEINVLETFRYSGLDPFRLTTRTRPTHIDYFYTYNVGEYLSIGCDHSSTRNTTFKFHNSTSHLYTTISKSRFESQATRNLNSSYLLCYYEEEPNGPTYTITLYFQAQVPQTPTSAPVAPQQPDTHTGRSAQAITTAVASALSHVVHPRADADKIWFTGFPSALIVTETHLAATYYVYKYKNNEELNVNCTASPGAGTVIFRFTLVNYPPESMESFVYRATLATNGSTLLCVLQQNNAMNVYSKRVTLLLDTAEPPTPTPATVQTTTPTTLQTTTITSREPRVINHNPATKPTATNKPETRTTKRTNPTRKPGTTRKPKTRAPWKPRGRKKTTTMKPRTTIKPSTENIPMVNRVLQTGNSSLNWQHYSNDYSSLVEDVSNANL